MRCVARSSLGDASSAVRTDAEALVYVESLISLYQADYGVVCPSVEVHLTGTKARRCLGYYTIPTRSIFINDRGMSDYSCRATLLHELAHHLQHNVPLCEGNTKSTDPGGAHGLVFQIHHSRLRALAYAKNLIPRLTDIDRTLGDVASRLQGLRRTNGEAILQIGQELAQARDRCRAVGESFEVFLMDSVSFDRTTAYDYIRAHEMSMPPDLNFTTMRFLMRIKNPLVRERAVNDASSGIPLVVLRIRYAEPKGIKQDEIGELLKEKARLVRRLEEIESLLKGLTSCRTGKAALNVQ